MMIGQVFEYNEKTDYASLFMFRIVCYNYGNSSVKNCTQALSDFINSKYTSVY